MEGHFRHAGTTLDEYGMEYGMGIIKGNSPKPTWIRLKRKIKIEAHGSPTPGITRREAI